MPQSGGPSAGQRLLASPSDAPAGESVSLVDPLVLSLACAGGGPLATQPPAVSGPAAGNSAPGSVDVVLAAEVLQRVAWGGDRRRGVARLELGGELAGAVVVVRGEGREVSVELTLPDGRFAAELPERLSARLTARGLVVRELVVL